MGAMFVRNTIQRDTENDHAIAEFLVQGYKVGNLGAPSSPKIQQNWFPRKPARRTGFPFRSKRVKSLTGGLVSRAGSVFETTVVGGSNSPAWACHQPDFRASRRPLLPVPAAEAGLPGVRCL